MRSIQELKKLNYKEKNQLAEDLRKKVIENVSKTGGHLASNLGVVELTIALHSVYDTPKDKIVFDVGHQCYVHKMLTGRMDKMNTLRQYKGISGFPKSNESEYDVFDTGHSSTSISVSAGIARVRDLNKKDFNVIAVIGDGSLTGGMAIEALNDVGASGLNMTVILNDNGMSISKNTGGISQILSNLRTKKSYINLNTTIKNFISKIPFIGKIIIHIARKIKNLIKYFFINDMYFEDIGFTYLGPVDGHNIKKLETILNKSKKINGPVLVHVITKKGKGYLPAEQNPDKFHSTSQFEIESGKSLNKGSKDYSFVFGEKLTKLAAKNKKIVAITAAMKDGTGLTKFASKYPNRFFDVGIAEQHSLGLAAGMAKEGYKPIVPIYSSFLQRAYDQLVHDICMQKLPVTICIDRAGIVGNDGETHQGILDLSFLSTIPNMTIMAPKDYAELESMLEFAINFDGPISIRYPRGTEGDTKFKKTKDIKLGQCEVISKGNDITILAIGKMVDKAYKIKTMLEKDNISAEVINVRFLKPLDSKEIIKSILKTKKVITLEDNSLKGGLYSSVVELINKNNLNINVKGYGYDDKYVHHGTVKELEKENGLDEESIYNNIIKM